MELALFITVVIGVVVMDYIYDRMKLKEQERNENESKQDTNRENKGV